MKRMSTMKRPIAIRLMMLVGSILTTGCATARPAVAQDVSSCEIEGVWEVPADQGPGLIEVTRANGTWTGYPVTPDGERVADYQILRGLRYDADRGHYEGTLAPPGGREVSATVSCVAIDELEVTGRRFGMSRSVRWTRYLPGEGSG
jgi:predicted small secreted protein